MTSKYPNCECKEKRFDYLRRRYKNGTLHMFRIILVLPHGVIKPNLQSRADAAMTKLQRHIQKRNSPEA